MSAALRVAITGATGFIGQRLARALRERGHSVRALVRDRSKATTLTALAGCAFAEVNLDATTLSADALGSAVEGIDALCHCAAYIPSDLRDPHAAARCLQVNALAPLALAEACAAQRTPRMLHFSSANVYTPSASPVAEDSPTYPSSRATYYLASKLCGELYVDHTRRRGALSATILRVSSVYGPGMKGGVVSLFAERLARGERVSVSDGGRYQTDLVYVDDVVAAAVAALERSSVSGIVNVGSGSATSLWTLAHTLATLTGRGADAIDVEPPSLSPVDPGFAPLDVSRARALLGYAPRSIEDGLRAFVAAR